MNPHGSCCLVVHHRLAKTENLAWVSHSHGYALQKQVLFNHKDRGLNGYICANSAWWEA